MTDFHFKFPLSRIRSTFACLVALTAFNVCPANARNVTREQILHISKLVKKESQNKTHMLRKLKTVELRSSQLQLEIKKINVKLGKQSLTLQELIKKRTYFQTKLNSLNQSLKNNLVAMYILDKEPKVEFLLNQAYTDQLDRMITYYECIDSKKIETINEINQTITAIKSNESKIEKQISQISHNKKSRLKRKLNLRTEINSRKHILTEMDRRWQHHANLLSSLKTRYEKLNQTVKNLDTDKSFRYSQNFSTLKGKLKWPTKGKISKLFNQHILHSQLHRDGVIIQANSGEKVQAIAKGRVIFSKWMLGYGRLLIISHGHGYMTLYGQNQNLFVKIGDTVKPGEIIATVGNTGGNKLSGLYFAIRHNATPLNPIVWCNHSL